MSALRRRLCLHLVLWHAPVVRALDAPWPSSVLFTVAVVVIALLFLLCIFLYCFAPEMGLAIWLFILDIATFCKLRGFCKCCPATDRRRSTLSVTHTENVERVERCPSIDRVFRSDSEPPPPYEAVAIISPSAPPLPTDADPPPPYEAIEV